ncbi:hypothetical protein [Streptomyces hydrogenans]|uniref:hypothetical protein n=1 Tax=Streptomyces hydrogenans TaxID=1873719 RepID=UPI0037F996C5
MRDYRRKKFARVSVLLGVMLVAIVSAYFIFLSTGRPPLDVSDVTGVWWAEGKDRVSSVSIRDDGTAVFDNAPPVCPPRDGEYYSGPASWDFYTVPDESPGILFRFPGMSDECRLSFSLVGQEEAFFTEDPNSIGYLRD